MKEQEVIPNWEMFGVRHTQVQIFKEDNGYRAGLFIFIDNETDKEKMNDYNVTIFTEIYNENPVQCAKIAFLYASTLFDNMDPIVKVWNANGEPEMEDIDLRNASVVPSGYNIH